MAAGDSQGSASNVKDNMIKKLRKQKLGICKIVFATDKYRILKNIFIIIIKIYMSLKMTDWSII